MTFQTMVKDLIIVDKGFFSHVNPDNYHPPLSFSYDLLLDPIILPFPSERLNFKRGNYKSLYLDLLSINQNNIFVENNIESQSLLLTETFKDLMQKHIPTFNPKSINHKKHYPHDSQW